MCVVSKEECREALNVIVERVYEFNPYAFEIRLSADIGDDAPEFYVSINGNILPCKYVKNSGLLKKKEEK